MQEHVNREFYHKSYAEFDPAKAFLTWCVTSVYEWENSKGHMDPELFVERIRDNLAQYEKACQRKKEAMEP